MKRIGHLFECVVEPDNLRLAFVKASRGKRHRADQMAFQRNLEVELTRLREGLLAGDYPVGRYKRFTIWEPKEREICAAAFGERVLHHALMNVCEPYFDKWLNMVMTDAQLAEAAKPEELTEAVLRSIEGFGEARMKKYAEALLKV